MNRSRTKPIALLSPFENEEEPQHLRSIDFDEDGLVAAEGIEMDEDQNRVAYMQD